MESERADEELKVERIVHQKLSEFPHDDSFDGGPLYTGLWYRYEIQWSDDTPRYLTLHYDGYTEICRLAEDNIDAFNLALKIAGTRLHAGKNLPDPLRCLVADYLLGRLAVPRRERGAPRSANWRRDYIILNLKEYMEEFAYVKATENVSGSKRNNERSVCGILTDEMRRNGFGALTLKSTLAVWRNEKKYEEYLDAKNRYVATKFDDLKDFKRT